MSQWAFRLRCGPQLTQLDVSADRLWTIHTLGSR